MYCMSVAPCTGARYHTRQGAHPSTTSPVPTALQSGPPRTPKQLHRNFTHEILNI